MRTIILGMTMVFALAVATAHCGATTLLTLPPPDVTLSCQINPPQYAEFWKTLRQFASAHGLKTSTNTYPGAQYSLDMQTHDATVSIGVRTRSHGSGLTVDFWRTRVDAKALWPLHDDLLDMLKQQCPNLR